MQEVRGQETRVFAWPGIHAEAGENVHVLAPGPTRAFVLTDRNCVEIARRVAMSLQQSKFEVAGCSMPPGRGRPSPTTIQQIDERLTRAGTDATTIVAVGGTPVMHMGSAIAVKCKGRMPLFLVPTSLRAQLDSSVGGASCCPIGGRWQPAVAVFADPTLLATLPLREYLAGIAEAVKCAMIANGELFDFLKENQMAIRDRTAPVMEELVVRSATHKANALDQAGDSAQSMKILEYGHTIGRALERVAGAAILHGEALAVGMEAEMALAHGLGWADKSIPEAQNRMLKSFGLPTRIRGLPGDRLLQALGNGGGPEFILPDIIGHARGPEKVSSQLLKAAVASITK
jgi:3-dehydroquinate synthetase